MEGNFAETLGRYLRREREARSVSLEELSSGTRISRAFLEALERDDLHFFSKREYILGFLRGYARHLGLDSEEVLKRYLIQSELTSRKETFKQLPLFSPPPPLAEEIPELGKVPRNFPPSKAGKRYHRRIFIQLAILIAAVSLTLYFQHLLKEAENVEKSAAAAKKGLGEREMIVNLKAPEKDQSTPQEGQDPPGEHSRKTNSSKNSSAENGGKVPVGEEAVKSRHPPASR